jgi:single-strand DNA-binding protein
MSNVFSGVCTVGRDAEVRYLPSGQAVLNVNVANNVGFGDKQQTVWLRVILWGKKAEGTLKDYLKKGQQVFVSGELTMSEYTANDGTKRTQLELNANVLDLVGKKNSDAPQPAPASRNPPRQDGYVPAHEQHRRDVAAHDNQARGYPEGDAPYDSDIPF